MDQPQAGSQLESTSLREKRNCLIQYIICDAVAHKFHVHPWQRLRAPFLKNST